MPAGMAGHGRLRAAHADRDQVIEVLKAAFVQGRLTKDEFDTRVAQVFAMRTYAELAAVTTDIPIELCGARSPANADIKTGVHVVIGAALVAIPMWAVTIFTSQFVSVISPPAVAATWLALLIISVGATVTVVVASLLNMALVLGSWHHKHSGEVPPRGHAHGVGG